MVRGVKVECNNISRLSESRVGIESEAVVADANSMHLRVTVRGREDAGQKEKAEDDATSEHGEQRVLTATNHTKSDSSALYSSEDERCMFFAQHVQP
jgi:hypothetical protein